MRRGVVRLDRSTATIVAVCSACEWRMVTAGYRRDSIAHDEAARHALAHGDHAPAAARAKHYQRRRAS